MKIFYQGHPGAYGHQMSLQIAKMLPMEQENIVGLGSFREVFTAINDGDIGVIPIENSSTGSIYENFYHIVYGKYTILSEIFYDIHHCLLGNTKNISDIKEVYSHPQALMQCDSFLHKHAFHPQASSDTAGAARFVMESKRTDIAAIASYHAASLYNLHILEENIENKSNNTTRFLVLTHEKNFNTYASYFSSHKKGKISLQFQTKDTPSALYKCLGAFATRFINLTKIESLPSQENIFEYLFWVDFSKSVDEKIIQDVYSELSFFSKNIRVIGEY